MHLSTMARFHLLKHETISASFVRAIIGTITGLIRLTSVTFPLKQLIRHLDRLWLLFTLSGGEKRQKLSI